MTLTKNILKLCFSVLLLLSIRANAQEALKDSINIAVKDSVHIKDTVLASKKYRPDYVLVGVDILKPLSNIWDQSKITTEFFVEVPYKNTNFVLETGFAKATFESKFLNYESQSGSVKLGVNKFLFDKAYDTDRDEIFSGIRYGLAAVKRGDAQYTITDIWGTTSGTVLAKKSIAHWGEIVLGLRMQVFKNLFAGWIIRGKFLINGNSFLELPPSYISGYGAGNKATVFDYGFNVSYSF